MWGQPSVCSFHTYWVPFLSIGLFRFPHPMSRSCNPRAEDTGAQVMAFVMGTPSTESDGIGQGPEPAQSRYDVSPESPEFLGIDLSGSERVGHRRVYTRRERSVFSGTPLCISSEPFEPGDPGISPKHTVSHPRGLPSSRSISLCHTHYTSRSIIPIVGYVNMSRLSRPASPRRWGPDPLSTRPV